MNKFIKLFLILTSLLMIFISCSNGTNSPTTTPADNPTTDNPTIKSQSVSKKLKLNITDATNLYIGKSNSTSSRSARAASNDTEKKLFKITEDGFVQEITYTYEITTVTEYEVPYEEEVYDEEGNVTGTVTKTKIETKTEVTTETATESYVPTSILKMNKDFLIVQFSSDNYLVNSATGDCYKYTNNIPTISNSLSCYYGDSIVTDSSDNIYFVSEGRIVKLDVSDPENVNLKYISASTENVGSTTWGVDENGNIAYEGRDASGNGVLRFKSSSGGFSNLPGNTNHSFTMFWQGLDGLLYYFNASNPTTKIKKLVPNPFSASDYAEESNSTRNMGACGFKALLRTKNKNRMILLADGSAYPEFYEVYNPETNILRRIEASIVGLNKIKFGISSDDYYYLVGTDSSNNSMLVKIEPTDLSYETLLSGGAYDIYNLTISSDEIIFNALRMNDGAIVLGKIENDKSIRILDENLEEQITILEKIK